MRSSLLRRLRLVLVCLACSSLEAQSSIDEGIRLSLPNPFSTSIQVGNPPTQTIPINVTVSDARCSEFRMIPPNAAWLTVNKLSGNAPDGVIVTIDYSTFAPNESRTALVTFESLNKSLGGGLTCLSAFGEGVVIFREILPITAKLLPAGPRPVPLPSPFILSLSDSTGAQQPISTFLDMSNAGDGSYTYAFEVSYSGASSGWLSVSPSGGTVSTTAVRHQVIANPAGLASGTHSAVLRVLHDAAGAPSLTIPVSLTLSGAPRFSVTPLTIGGAARRGKQNPASVSLSVTNTGGGTVSYQIASSVPWMTVTPPQGQSSGGTAVAHTVAFNALSLPVGVHTASLTISTSAAGIANNPVTVPVSIDVNPGGTISIAPAEVQVSAAVGSAEPRQIRLRLESPEIDALQWRARTEPPNVQWLRLLDRGGTLPGAIVAEIDASSVPRPLLVSAGIVIEAFDPADAAALAAEGSTPEQSADAIIRTIVPVSLQTVSQAPALSVAPSRIELIAAPGGGVRVHPISISMSGGAPALAWQASLEVRRGASGNVFRIVPEGGSGPGIVTVSGDPTGLAPGVYDADVLIRAGAAEQRIPVAMLVTGPGQSIVSTGQTALALRGSAAALPAEIPIANLGGGVTPNVTIRSTTLSGAGWLTAAAATDSFKAEALGTGLAAGVVHGLLEIVAPGASNSPQFLPVVYEREAPGAAPDLMLDPGGLVFVRAGGAAVPGQTIQVATTSDTPLRALVGVSTDTGANWLSASPVDGQVSARSAMTVEVQVEPAGLGPGFHRGRVTIAIPGGPAQSVSVTLVVAPGSPCSPRSIAVVPLAPPEGFRATAGHPVTVEAGLVDDCGFPVRGGVAVHGSARGVMLRDMGESGGQARGPEIFRGTMQFPAPGDVEVLFRAAANALGTAERRLSGSVIADAEGAASHSATSLVHAATFGLGRPLAPGAIATVFGTGFPATAQQPSTLPLPETLEGFSVQVAGRPAPLFYLDSTQANLQIPVETPADTLVQSLVRVGQRYLPAETFFSSAAQPGLFPLSQNRAVVVNQNGTVNTPLNPERRGRVIVAYLTGIGATLPASATGRGAPASEPYARAALRASATVGGADAEIVFLGMTPGYVGLTQANLRIGDGAATGPNVPIVIEVGGYRSPEMWIAVEP